MSDNFSWAPFGSTRDDDLEPLPPLPPLPSLDPSTADQLGQDQPAVQVPRPEDYVSVEPEALPFDIQAEQPLPPPPAPLTALTAAAPAPATAMDTPWGQTAPPSGLPTDKRQRPTVKGGGDAAAAFIWGVLGLTFCPILIPSIVAVRKGAQAKAAGGGLGGTNLGLANWGVALGWIGIVIWALIIVVGIAQA